MVRDSNKTSHRARRSLKGLRRGDLESLDYVWHSYSRRIYGFFYRMCWNPAEAAALTEETFAVLWRGALLLGDDPALDIILYRLARNVFLAHEGEASRSPVQHGEEAGGAGAEPVARSSRLPLVAPAEEPASRSRRAAKSQRRSRDVAIAKALLELDTEAHIVFVLLLFQGLTPAQVADVTGLRVGEVHILACLAEASVRSSLGTALVAGVPDDIVGGGKAG
jgi:DNA-directed RNA polymerase specialized sigma24 family protein